MTKNKLIGLLATATVFVAPVIAVSCGVDSTSQNEMNRKQGLDDVQGTAGQLQNVYTQVDSGITSSLAKLTDTSTEKTALTAFQTALKPVIDGIKSEGGALRAKIVALKHNETDYATKLEQVKTDLLASVTKIRDAYRVFAKALDSASTDATADTAFNNISSLTSFFGTYNTVRPQTPHLLDLARLFEAFGGGIGNTLVSKYDGTTGNNSAKVKELGKLVAQILNLITKRELQTVVMAQVFIAPNLSAQDQKTAFTNATLKALSAQRRQIAVLPEGFRTKVTALEAKITTLKTAWTAADTASKATGLTALSEENKTKLAKVGTSVTTIDARYKGATTLTPGFTAPGLKGNVTKLQTALAALPTSEITTVDQFNAFYKAASPTWMDAAGMFVNSNFINNNVTSASKEVGELVSAITGTGTQDMALKTALTTLGTALTAVGTDSSDFVSQAEAKKDVSAWKLNQNIRGISSYAQILLLQAAVSLLKLTPADYAVGPITTS